MIKLQLATDIQSTIVYDCILTTSSLEIEARLDNLLSTAKTEMADVRNALYAFFHPLDKIMGLRFSHVADRKFVMVVPLKT